MIMLFGGGAGFGLPDVSPFVLKTETQLKMAALPYEKLQATPADAPKGQIPFIEDGGLRIGDSTFIRRHLERTHGVDFDEHLEPQGRAQAWAYERMIENHLNPAMIHFRWLVPENFAKGPALFFERVPEPMRAAVRESALANVTQRVRGALGAHDDGEIALLGGQSLTALSAILGERSYLMGERPCGADAAAFANLACVYAPFFDTELRRRALRHPNLAAYVDRLMTQFFPEFPWAGVAAQKEPAAV